MIKAEELYEKTKIPANEKLLDTLIRYYLSIPFSELNRSDWNVNAYKEANGHTVISSKMYNQINAGKRGVYDEKKINREENLLESKVNQDFINAGKPFDPALHGGKTEPLTVQKGWKTFKSWNLLGTSKIHSKDQLHRFYLPVASNDKYDFASELYDEFKRVNIPFYFKVEESMEDRPDKIVIYTSSQLIPKTLSVIDNVAKKRPELMQNFSELSPVVGKVTDKVGYASEYPNIKYSYTQIICDCFSDAVEELINEYISKPISTSIKNIYFQKINEMKKLNPNLENYGKKRILMEVLLKNDTNFKYLLLEKFRTYLYKNDIDVNNICFNNIVKKSLDASLPLDLYDPIVQNRIITLPNGKKMTVAQYFTYNNLTYWVPENAKVTFKNGRTISGRKFLSEAVNKLEKFNTWEELILHYKIRIERYPRIQQEKTKEEQHTEVFDDTERKKTRRISTKN
jgi:hypothetical protein